jgi:hypothetical protein
MEFVRSYVADLILGWFGIVTALLGVVDLIERLSGKPIRWIQPFLSARRRLVVLIGCLFVAGFSVASSLNDRLEKQEGLLTEQRDRHNQYEPGVDPVLDLALGEPFGDSTLIRIRNSGVVPIVGVAANLRCFLLKERTDLSPVLFFEGFPSIENRNSWWTVPKLDPGGTETKNASDSFARCLHNRAVWEASAARPKVVDTIVSIDLVYERLADHKRYTLSGIGTLMKHQTTGNPVVWPLSMTEFHRRLLDTVTPPSYRTTVLR